MYYHRIYTAPHILSYPSMRATLPLCWCNLTCIIQSQHPFAHTLYFQEKMMLLYPIGLVLHINVRQTQISFRNFVLLHPPFPKKKNRKTRFSVCHIISGIHHFIIHVCVCVCVGEIHLLFGVQSSLGKDFPCARLCATISFPNNNHRTTIRLSYDKCHSESTLVLMRCNLQQNTRNNCRILL